MKSRITYDLRFIHGAFWGAINDKSLPATIDMKEDYERSVLYCLAHGGVVRFDGLSGVTKVYSGKGGLQAFRTREKEEAAVASLLRRYPKLVRRKIKSKSAWPEISLLNPKEDKKKFKLPKKVE
jgi:hypothetical protein